MTHVNLFQAINKLNQELIKRVIQLQNQVDSMKISGVSIARFNDIIHNYSMMRCMPYFQLN